MPRRILSLVLLIVLILSPASAVRAEAPSSSEARERLLAAIPQRLLRAVGPEKILTLEPREVPALLTPAERELLSSGHVAFRINVPTIVSVMRTTASASEPFWLDERGFERTDLRFKVGEHTYEAWERRFDAGLVSLGISSFSGKHYPYFVALNPANAGDVLEVTDLYPKRLKLGTLGDEVEPLVDRHIKVAGLPSELDGQVMIRTSRSWSRDAAPLEQFLKTKHPASARPDHVVLTWSDDPRTTMTIQWRTGAKTSEGRVQYREKPSGGGAAAATRQGCGSHATAGDPDDRQRPAHPPARCHAHGAQAGDHLRVPPQRPEGRLARVHHRPGRGGVVHLHLHGRRPERARRVGEAAA